MKRLENEQMKAITNRKLRKYRTMKKITKRHLKRFLAKVKSKREEREVQVVIVHDKIPLYLNQDKRQFSVLHPWAYDMADSAYFVDGKLIECCGPNDVVVCGFIYKEYEDKN